MNKLKAKLCPNGIMKIYNPDGTRYTPHPTGFWTQKDIEFLRNDFELIGDVL